MTLPRRNARCGGCGGAISNTEPFIALLDEASQTFVDVYHPTCQEAAEERVRRERLPQGAWTFYIGGMKYAPAPPESKKTRKLRWKGRP